MDNLDAEMEVLQHLTARTPRFMAVDDLCEHYELKIDYVAMDQVCTWSHYQVDILLYD
jgi:hypothetical protein